jgi:hypothetical protein
MPLKTIKRVITSVKDVRQHIGLYTVKSMSIFLVSIYYFIFCGMMSIGINNIVPHKTEEELKQMPTLHLGASICIIVGSLAVGYYLVRNLLSDGPLLFDQWFFEGWYGYKHEKLREAATGGIVVATVIFFFQDRLKNRLAEFSKRFTITAEATKAPGGE